MKSYFGYRTHEGDPIVYMRVDNGPVRPFVPDDSWKLRNHSPCGFEWGYGGSGPAQLALALVLDATGDPDLTLGVYQCFKFAHVVCWDKAEWWTTNEDICRWVENLILTDAAARGRVEHYRSDTAAEWDANHADTNPEDAA